MMYSRIFFLNPETSNPPTHTIFSVNYIYIKINEKHLTKYLKDIFLKMEKWKNFMDTNNEIWLS